MIELEVRPQVEKAKEVLDSQIMQTCPEIAYSINQKNTTYKVLLRMLDYTEQQNVAGALADQHAILVKEELY